LALSRFLGPSQGPTTGWGSHTEFHATAAWGFFTVKDSATVETVGIFCDISRRIDEPDWRVDGMEVSRGVARAKGFHEDEQTSPGSRRRRSNQQ
jgi:hypothetical protein